MKYHVALKSLCVLFGFLSSCAIFTRDDPLPEEAFPYGGKAVSVATGEALFKLPGDVRLRGMTTVEGGYLAWDKEGQRLHYLSESGTRLASWRMEADFVWLSGHKALARDFVFTEGKGFRFSLQEIDLLWGPEEVWDAPLDCFASDVLFMPGGSVFLCGGDEADNELSVFEIRPGAEARSVLSMPKDADFPRLVPVEGAVLAFTSAREIGSRELKLWYMATTSQTSVFGPLSLDEAPAGGLCFFGYGLSFAGDALLPLAMEDGDISLLRLSPGQDSLITKSISSGSRGCVLSLGSNPDGTAVRYLAHLGPPDPDAWAIGSYNAESLSFLTLP